MLPLPIEELRDCAPDAICLTAGVKLRHEPHFLHPLFTEKASDPTRAICQAILDATGIGGVDRSQRGVIVERAVSTDMFGDISATASQITVTSIMHGALADVRKLCQPIEQSDYRASAFGIVEVDEVPEGGTTEGSNVEIWKVTASGESIQIQDFVRLVVYSREILVNEGLPIIPATSAAVGMAVARQIAQRFVSILEDNADLSDGVALFAAGEGNLLTSGIPGYHRPGCISRCTAELADQRWRPGQRETEVSAGSDIEGDDRENSGVHRQRCCTAGGSAGGYRFAVVVRQLFLYAGRPGHGPGCHAVHPDRQRRRDCKGRAGTENGIPGKLA